MTSKDLRNTQEMVGDFFGGVVSLGAKGVDGLIMARGLARLLIQKGIITREEYIDAMKAVIREELSRDDNTTFLEESYKGILKSLDERHKARQEE